jgi:hypothetical protein
MSKRSVTLEAIAKTRRSELVDAEQIVKFVNASTMEQFGPKCKEIGKIWELIEKSILAITLEGENSNIIGQGCFFDYPNVYNIDADKWEDWMHEYYDTNKMNSWNTLFLHFYAADSKFTKDCANVIIEAAFKEVPDCHYIVLCGDNSSIPESSLGSLFEPLTLNSTLTLEQQLKPESQIFLIKREKFVPVLFIRESK